ncbi:MAG: efflux RND transporter permease subunit [Spirochaetes bacterium]|nr:efflux RND transporter permease subunit [Spirochaetota bacterium]
MKKIYDYFSGNPVLINLIYILIILIGLISLTKLKREVFPGTETDTMIVNVVYPGAGPVDIETNVIIPMETSLRKIIGIKDYVSISMENGARLYIYLQDKLSNAKEVKDEIIRELTNLSDIPDDVEEISIININPKRMSVYSFGISIKDETQTNMKELFDFYDKLEKKMKNIEGVAEIKTEGYLDPEIKIRVNPFKINSYNLPLNSIIDSIRSRNIRSTGGTIQSVTKDQNIVTLGQFNDPMDVKDVIIRANYEGKRIFVKDLADVKMGFKEKNIEVYINQKKGLTVSFVKNEDADITLTIQNIKKFIEANKEQIEKKFIISAIDDKSLSIKSLLNVVQSNAIIGFILVFIILIFFLDFKSAFWTALGIPTAILITMTYMYMNDISLNIITLGALITVLGMLVDDAIVVSENIHIYKLKGISGLEAGFKGLIEVLGPIIVSVSTTIVAFLPLLAIKGKMGLFIKVFPLIVSVALLGSLLDAIFLLPHHLSHGKKKTIQKKNWFDPIAKFYKKILMIILKFRYITLAFFIIILIITIFLSLNAFKKFILLKDDTADTLLVNLEAPTGTNFSATSQLTKKLENEIIKNIDPKILISVNSVIGHHRVKSSNDRGNYENWAQIALYFLPSTERIQSIDVIMTDLKKVVKQLGNTGFKKILFAKRVVGPDPGMGVDIKIAGVEFNNLKEAAASIEKYLSTIDGVGDIDNTDKPGKEEIIINFNYPEMAKLNVDVSMVAQTVKTAYDGTIVTSFQTEDKKIDYRLELDTPYKRDVTFLKSLLIPNKQGRLIKLQDIAECYIKQGINVIDHYNGDKAISITANVHNKKITPKEVMSLLKNEFKSLQKKYPGIYLISGGEAAETEESINDLFFAFILALIAIYSILIILFKDPIQPFLVLIVIPFGLVGAFLAFLLHGVPLSFMGMIGLIGLSGVVVNDSVVMIEFIDRIIKSNANKDKRKIKELIAEGAQRRLRPVILTTLTTVAGLLPTVYGIGGKAESIVPTVMAMSYGILFATLLTLFFLPSLYLIIIDIKNILSLKRKEG